MIASSNDCDSPLRGITYSSEQRFLPVESGHHEFIGKPLEIRAVCWRPTQPRASILLVQGRAGFLEKYLPVVARLLQRNLEVVSFDWRGQGGSSRLIDNSQAGYVPGFDDYLDDLQAVISADLFSTPVRFILAHSMGGHLVLRWLAERHPDGETFRRVWLTATLADLVTDPYPRWFARAVSYLACRCGFAKRYVFGGGRYDPEAFRDASLSELTSDVEEVERQRHCLQQHPELQLGSPSFAWLQAAFRSIVVLNRSDGIARIRVPVTQFVAGADQVVDNRAIYALDARLTNGTVVSIPGALHELLLESDVINQPLWSLLWEQLEQELSKGAPEPH